MLPNPIVPGKYMTRDKKRAIVRWVETEFVTDVNQYLGYVFRGGGVATCSWASNGKFFGDGPDSNSDLVSAGWPIQLEVGKWYRLENGETRKCVGQTADESLFLLGTGDCIPFRYTADGKHKNGCYSVVCEVPPPNA